MHLNNQKYWQNNRVCNFFVDCIRGQQWSKRCEQLYACSHEVTKHNKCKIHTWCDNLWAAPDGQKIPWGVKVDLNGKKYLISCIGRHLLQTLSCFAPFHPGTFLCQTYFRYFISLSRSFATSVREFSWGLAGFSGILPCLLQIKLSWVRLHPRLLHRWKMRYLIHDY